MLLIDTLDLPSSLASFERSQAAAFLRQNGGRLGYPVTVYSLRDSGFFLTARSSLDGNALVRAVDSQAVATALFIPKAINAPAFPSPLYPIPMDATFTKFPPLTALRALGAIATDEDRTPGHKVLLWIGPGLRDSGTGAYPDTTYLFRDGQGLGYALKDLSGPKGQRNVFGNIFWFSTLLRQARLTVDVFSVGERDFGIAYAQNAAQPSSGHELLSDWTTAANAWKKFLGGVPAAEDANAMDLYKKVLAVDSGGRVLPPDHDLVQQMNESLRGAGTYYTLTFDPPPAAHADEYHSLEVKLGRPGLAAHTSTGYYDEPYYTDSPAPGVRHLSVAQLEPMLNEDGRKSAAQLANTELTERITAPAMESLLASAHGGDTRESLQLAADEAAFLTPPAEDILHEAPPSPQEQDQILSAAGGYLSHTIPRLPDFFATREAVRYGETAAYHELNTDVDAVPLHVEERSKGTVVYRHGEELVNGASRNQLQEESPLFTYGTFGPILGTVRATLALSGSIGWSRWERIGGVRRAVFHYSVSAADSPFRVRGCIGVDSAPCFSLPVAYHGEVAIDPASGAILRVQLQPDFPGFVPGDQSSLMVSYGPVAIGGRSWILPVRSVSIARVRALEDLAEWNVGFHTWGPFETRINDFTFSHYHKYQGSARILPGYTPVPGAGPH